MANYLLDKIEINPKVMVGKPIIRGTRITVELILRQLAQGLTIEKILQNYPHITEEDIRACVAYGARLVKEERIYPNILLTKINVKALNR